MNIQTTKLRRNISELASDKAQKDIIARFCSFDMNKNEQQAINENLDLIKSLVHFAVIKTVSATLNYIE